MSHFVYIVRGSDNSLYTGYSIDLSERIKKHNSKKGSKSLMGKLPVKLVYQEKFETKSEALKREVEIKKYTRKEKLSLISRG